MRRPVVPRSWPRVLRSSTSSLGQPPVVGGSIAMATRPPATLASAAPVSQPLVQSGQSMAGVQSSPTQAASAWSAESSNDVQSVSSQPMPTGSVATQSPPSHTLPSAPPSLGTTVQPPCAHAASSSSTPAQPALDVQQAVEATASVTSPISQTNPASSAPAVVD